MAPPPETKTGLSSLPLELLIQILDELDWQDLIRTRQLSSFFCDIINESTHLQYRIELASAQMEDWPCQRFDISSKLELLRKYRSKWFPFIIDDDAPALGLDVPGESPRFARYYGGYTQTTDGKAITFVQTPSYLHNIGVDTWTIELDFPVVIIVCRPEQDLAIVVRREDVGPGECPKFYARPLHTSGRPHRLAQAGELPISTYGPTFLPDQIDLHFAICGNKLSSLMYWKGPDGYQWEFTVWDWHSGSYLSPYPSRVTQLLTLPGHIQQNYMTQSFLHNEKTIILGGFLSDPDGTQIGAFVDLLEMVDIESKKAARFHFPPFAPGWTSNGLISVEHRAPVGSSSDYCFRPPFQISDDASIFSVTFVLSNEQPAESVPITIIVSVGKLLQYMETPRNDVASRNISWDEWGPSSTRAFPYNDFSIAGARAFRVQDIGIARSLHIADFACSVHPFRMPDSDNNLPQHERVRDPHTLNLEAFHVPITTSLPYNLYKRPWPYGPLVGATEDSFLIRGVCG